MGLPRSAYELQTLFGMGDVIQKVLVERGHRVRVYTPYGAILPGMAYLVRRLLENTSNESFLKASLAESAPIDDLLRDPEEIGAMLTRKRRPKGETSADPAQAAAAAVSERAAARFRACREPRGDAPGDRVGAIATGPIVSALDRRPGDRHRGPPARFGRPEPELADRRPGRAGRASSTRKRRSPRPGRRSRPGRRHRPEKRAAVLIEAAAIMRNRRFELAAWEVFECGKPWAEADADIAEAIDFCEFYAREMCRLAEPRHRDASGETNFTEPIRAASPWSSLPGTSRWRSPPA